MLFIVPFIFLCILVAIILLCVAGGTIAFSGDGSKPLLPSPQANIPRPMFAVAPVVSKPKVYIDLGQGRLIELFTKAEQTKAQKDGYKIVHK